MDALKEQLRTRVVGEEPRGEKQRLVGRRPGWRRRVAIGLVPVFLLGIAVAANRMMPGTGVPEMAFFSAKRGEFVISLVAKEGELEASKADKVTAPRVRGELKIVKLWPEGEKVEVGDLIVQFDQEEFKKRVTDAEEALEVAKAEYEKTLANQASQIARLESDIEDKEASLRLEQLNLEKMKYEADVKVEEARLKVRKAELALESARGKLESQRKVDAAERTKLKLDVAQKERDLGKARRDLENLSIYAEKPGIVVYEKVWKGGRREKIRVGDTPWSGQTLIDLPDLSVMEVRTEVNEVDVDKVEVGQRVLVKLDALPEPVFHGEVTEIAPLARQKEEERNVKVFDVVVTIDERDERLKPGMSATSEIIIETIPDVVYVPLESVFEKDGRTVVYLMGGSSPEEVEVRVGKKNDNYVIVEEGLEEGGRVTLRDPTLKLEEIGTEVGGEGRKSGEREESAVSVGG